MFTANDMLSLDYFNVLSETNSGDWELQSKNTNQYWKLINEGICYSLYHKHQDNHEYHHQTDIGSLYDVVLYIVSHDEYQMRGRRAITRDEEHRRESYFFKLIEKFGI